MDGLGASIARQIADRSDASVAAIPSDAQRPVFVVRLRDGRVPLLVRDFGHAIGLSIRGARSWSNRRDRPSPTVVVEAVEAIAHWAATHSPESVSLYELALRATDSLAESLGTEWSASFPGTPDPTECWVHPAVFDAGSVGIFEERAVVWVRDVLHEFRVTHRGELACFLGEVVDAARLQGAEYAANRIGAERMTELADELADRLTERLGFRCRAVPMRRESHASSRRIVIASDRTSPGELVEIEARGGRIVAHAGVPGNEGWDGELVDVASTIEPIVDAIRTAFERVTIDAIRPGRLYRVLEGLQGLERGAIVRFVRFDDIDNHFGAYEFESSDGRTMRVEGDFSTPRRSPLGEAHRFLAIVDGDERSERPQASRNAPSSRTKRRGSSNGAR